MGRRFGGQTNRTRFALVNQSAAPKDQQALRGRAIHVRSILEKRLLYLAISGPGVMPYKVRVPQNPKRNIGEEQSCAMTR